MRVTQFPRLLLASLTALLALSAAFQGASASHSWGNYHWARTANPFSLSLGDNVTSNWDAQLALASTDWSQSTVLDTTVVAGQSSGKCRPTAGRVEVCNDKYGRNGWLGLAQIWASGNHITQGVAKMNDTYFNMPAYNTTAEKNHVMCQEVGHTFGLGHQDESGASLGTCMDYADDSTNSQHPNAHDYDQLATIYKHLDSTTTVGVSSAKGAKGALHSRAEWGRLIHTSEKGRASVYVRDFGGGNKVFTHVYWAR